MAEAANFIKITGEAQYDKIIAENKVVLVDFNATWCPPCQKAKPVVHAVAEKNPTLMVLDVDVDQNRDLAGKYKIASIPTFYIYCDGKKVKESQGWDASFIGNEIPKVMPEFKK